MDSQVCTKCGQTKSLTDFYRQAASKSGYAMHCKACMDANRRRNRDKKRRRRKVEVPDTKVCRRCEVEKKAEEFSAMPSSGDGLYSYCRACKASMVRRYTARNGDAVRERARQRNATPKGRLATRKANLKRVFGIEKTEYDKRWRAQGKKCAICERTRKRNEKYFALDHDHSSGAHRGILCPNCNRALGLAADNIDLLKRAEKYLRRAR